MPFSSIDLCSRALTKIGTKSIASFNEKSAEASVAEQLYTSTVDGLLSAYPWRFATTQKELARLQKNPNGDYKYAYALPNDFLRAISAGPIGIGKGLDYRIQGNQLHTDSETVLLTYVFKPNETDFPPFFSQLVISFLATEFCLPLTESTNRTEHLRKMADKDFSMAKNIDSQQSIPTAFQDFSLIEVRL
ncbi:MAG: hypothetical protein IKV03_04180 [Alphaproteobacteria bacterium]|nr:hypothetical protein [Alphaproteobacteria bacterium]